MRTEKRKFTMGHPVQSAGVPEHDRGPARLDVADEKFNRQICIGITSHKVAVPALLFFPPEQTTGAMGATALNTVRDLPLSTFLPNLRLTPPGSRIAPGHVRRVHLPLWPKFGARFERYEKRERLWAYLWQPELVTYVLTRINVAVGDNRQRKGWGMSSNEEWKRLHK